MSLRPARVAPLAALGILTACNHADAPAIDTTPEIRLGPIELEIGVVEGDPAYRFGRLLGLDRRAAVSSRRAG